MAAQLDKVTATVDRLISAGKIPGAITLVAQGGQLLHLDARGKVTASDVALKTDSIVWLASLSKAITAVGILMLADDGKLKLDDPASRYIPEFKTRRKVRIFDAIPGVQDGMLPAISPPGTNDVDPPHRLVDAEREIVLRDMMTHTAGVQTIAVANTKVPELLATDKLADWVARCAGIDHDFQPRSRWAYSNSVGFDILARVIEIVAQQPFDEFLRRRLFTPLGMKDIGFAMNGDVRAMPLGPVHRGKLVNCGPLYKSGSSGLWGSAETYWRFAEMLRSNGGNILSAQSVKAMTSNQVGDLFPGLNGRKKVRGLGFGYGVAVVLDAEQAGLALPNGSFGWDGVGSRRFWVDPGHEAVLFMYAPDADAQAEIEAAAVGSL